MTGVPGTALDRVASDAAALPLQGHWTAFGEFISARPYLAYRQDIQLKGVADDRATQFDGHFFPAVIAQTYGSLESALLENCPGNDDLLDLVETASMDGIESIVLPQTSSTDLVILPYEELSAIVLHGYTRMRFRTKEQAVRCSEQLRSQFELKGAWMVFAVKAC
jgi:hypothetical protein